MADTITQEPVSFPSTDAETTIHGYIWRDEGCASPRGIIQVAHGMAEHIERYGDFARFLASKGFIVGGYDHLAAWRKRLAIHLLGRARSPQRS